MLTKISNDDGWKRELGVNNTPTSRAAPIPRVPVSSGNTHAKTSTNDRHVHPASREELGVHHAHARRPGKPRRRRRRRRRRRLEGVVKASPPPRRIRVEFAGRPARSPRRARRRALRRARALRGDAGSECVSRICSSAASDRRTCSARKSPRARRAPSAAGDPRSRFPRRSPRWPRRRPEVFCGTPHRARFECRLLCGVSVRCGAGNHPPGFDPDRAPSSAPTPVPPPRSREPSAAAAFRRRAFRSSPARRAGFFVLRLARAGSRPRRPRAGPRPRAGLGVGAADVRVGGRG